MSQATPSRLYHYTGPDGLLGILSEGVLHATDLRYVNDRAEYAHALAIASDLVAAENAIPDELLATVIREISNDWLDSFSGAVYIASFSERDDDLGQWRAYSSGGTGFCLGFDTTDLVNAAGDRWTLSQCEYNLERKRQRVWDAIERTLFYRSLREWPLDEEHIAHKLADHFLEELADVAPLLKDSAFDQESEWRLWSENPAEGTRWRPGQRVPVPHVRIPFRCESISALRSIRIGPTADLQLARLSVRGLLEEYESAYDIEVEISKVPYRGQS